MSKRKYPPISGYPGISRILIEDLKSGKWIEPKRGKRFRADRYLKTKDGEIKRKFHFFQTFNEAKAFRAGQISINAASPETTPPKTQAKGGMLFRELVEQWKAVWLPNKDISTRIRYRSYLQHLNFFMDMPVDAIEPSDVDKWIVHIKKPEYLAKGHTTRCTFNHEFSVFRGILNFYATRFNRNYRLPFIKDHKAMLKVREKMKSVKDLNVEEFRPKSAFRKFCKTVKP